MPSESGQFSRVWRKGAVYGGRQSVHPQEQGAHGLLPRPAFGNFVTVS